MTQKDLADLRHDEIDWTDGRITRKRSKTGDKSGVPEVSYRLWPETLQLLKQESSQRGEIVLLNANGGPIWTERLDDSGEKYRKNDNVRNAYGRLCRKLKIAGKPFKSLKKTSASLIRSSFQYASLEHLFLGHAAGSVAHRHYTLAPQALLDQAIAWLRGELGIGQTKPPGSPRC